jgi:SAM-dependent methyltransferase
MRRCLRCSAEFPQTTGWKCTRCGFDPPSAGGTRMFAPELADTEADYEARFFDQLFDAEPRNFWFRNRNSLIARMLRDIDPPPQTFLEIGCGTGFVLAEVAGTFPSASPTATDVLPEAFSFARRRVPRAEFLQLDVASLPFTAEFDLVCAFDVLEHVLDDERALREVHRALRPRGWMLLTVPQHRFLWSKTDEIAHHKRRYRREEMRTKLDAAGFEIVRRTSFVTLLVPLLFLARKRVKTCEDAARDLLLPRPVDVALSGIMALERLLIGAGLDLPFGGSMIVLARRR